MKDKSIKIALFMLTLVISTLPIANADINNKGKMPFQRLSDVALFNGTDLIPENIMEHAIIPNGFFVPLEKKANISKILESNKQHNKQKEERNNHSQNKPNIHKSEIPISVSTSSSNCADIGGQSIIFDNATILWNSTEEGRIDESKIVKDLDGDGLNDTLVTLYKYDSCTDQYYYTIEAKKGKDGSNLWSKTISGASVWAYANIIDDINGDHLSDVIIQIYKYDTVSGGYYYTIEADKGKDGTHLWDMTAIDGFINGDSAGDVNGDKLNDIIVNVQYYTPYFSMFSVRKGIDGTNLWTENVSNGYIYGESVGDLNGDGLSDILTISDNSSVANLKAKKGIDGTNLWTESISNGHIYANSVGDLTGDGLNDILVNIGDYSTNSESLKAKKGFDGTNLWTESVSNGYIYGDSSVGNLNGDGLNDILVSVYDYNSKIYTLKAKKGIDGTNLWTESIYNGNIYANSVGDLTGDGLNDLLVNEYDYNSNIYTLKAKKGIDGTNLWTESVSNGYIYGDSVGDLNGDKLNDILVTIHYYSNIGILEAKKGIDGTNLWTESVSNGYANGDSVGDLNGDKLNDILVSIDDQSTKTGLLKAKKGIDGTNLWTESVSNGNIYGESAGDLTGDKLNDILVTVNDYSTDSGLLKTKKGNDGSNLWQARSIPIGVGWSDLNNYNLGYDLNGDQIDDILLYKDNNVYLVSSVKLASITIISPNGGENWQTGSTQTIKWSSTGNPGSNVKIDLLKGGSVVQSIATSTTNDGSYDWPISSSMTPGTNYKIRITSTSNAAYTDDSDNDFTIISPLASITVVSPNGGEIWQSGSTKTVKWSFTGNPGSTVNVDLLKNGVLVKTIASGISIGSSGNGTYSWRMDTSRTPGTDYKIRVSTSNSAYTDMSDNNFTITGPIIVTSPNGGENWRHGTSHTITWSKAGSSGSYVKIELLRSGSAIKTITSSTSNDGSYSWSISSTQTVASDYQIRITSTSNSAYKDTSDNYFIIST